MIVHLLHIISVLAVGAASASAVAVIMRWRRLFYIRIAYDSPPAPCHKHTAAGGRLHEGLREGARVRVGLGRIVALHHRASASCQIREYIRCLYF